MSKAPFELSLLAQFLERAGALGDRDAVLLQAFRRGVTWLATRSGEKPSSTPSEREGRLVGERASFDLLRQRALDLRRHERALEGEVDELASANMDLQDQIWEWRTRAQEHKVALGRLTAAMPRPEPALTIGTGSRERQPDTVDRLLGVLEPEQIELELPAELVNLARGMAEREGWGESWGVEPEVVGLTYGLAILEHESGVTAALPVPDVSAALAGLLRLVQRLVESLRILEMRRTALRIDNQGMRLRLDGLVEEVEGLERELSERGPRTSARQSWARRFWPFRSR